MADEKKSKPGHKELKPFKGNQGRSFSMGGKNWVSSRYSEIKDNKGKVIKKVYTESKTRWVPETVIADLKLPDHLFVSGPDKPKKKAAQTDDGKK